MARIKVPMEITTTAMRSFEKVALDIVKPLSEKTTGNKYLLTFQDDLTKYVNAIPIEIKEAFTVARTNGQWLEFHVRTF